LSFSTQDTEFIRSQTLRAISSNRAPGLHFVGYTHPFSGAIREMAIDARRLGRVVRANSELTINPTTARSPELTYPGAAR